MCQVKSNRSAEAHPFEAAGLGAAPFKFLGMDVEVGPVHLANGMTVGAPGQPMGTCDYCGNGIKYVCRVRSADGNVFRIGCDCVKKLSDERNAKTDPVISQINKAKRDLDRKIRHEREAKQISEGREFVEANLETLKALPHGQKWLAEKGQTAADEFAWMMKNSGNAGKIRAIRAAKKRIESAK